MGTSFSRKLMDMNNNLIKAVIPYQCPHCQADLQVCIGTPAPGLLWVETAEQVLQNKERLKELLRGVAFRSKQEEEEQIAYIDSDEFVLGENDVEEMARDIVESQKG